MLCALRGSIRVKNNMQTRHTRIKRSVAVCVSGCIIMWLSAYSWYLHAHTHSMRNCEGGEGRRFFSFFYPISFPLSESLYFSAVVIFSSKSNEMERRKIKRLCKEKLVFILEWTNEWTKRMKCDKHNADDNTNNETHTHKHFTLKMIIASAIWNLWTSYNAIWRRRRRKNTKKQPSWASWVWKNCKEKKSNASEWMECEKEKKCNVCVY